MPLAPPCHASDSPALQELSLLAYQSLVDFVPNREPYEFSTEVGLTPTNKGTQAVITVEPLHDDTWTPGACSTAAPTSSRTWAACWARRNHVAPTADHPGERDMDTARITEILTDPVTLDLVEKQPITRIAYAASDGSPRVVPLGYLLRDGKFLFFTIPTSDKVAALHRDPRIALTIDVYPPPCCLLVRGGDGERKLLGGAGSQAGRPAGFRRPRHRRSA